MQQPWATIRPAFGQSAAGAVISVAREKPSTLGWRNRGVMGWRRHQTKSTSKSALGNPSRGKAGPHALMRRSYARALRADEGRA